MSFRLLLSISIAVAVGCTTGPLHAGTLHGKVVKVIDGDSIIVKTKNGRVEVRLYGIDSPEYDQPYALRSKKMTRRMVKGRTVDVKGVERDKYGRLIAVVYQGANCINGELVKNGGAWVYERYCKKKICRQWKNLESAAKRDNRGLWKESNPLPPWEWRYEKHEAEQLIR